MSAARTSTHDKRPFGDPDTLVLRIGFYAGPLSLLLMIAPLLLALPQAAPSTPDFALDRLLVSLLWICTFLILLLFCSFMIALTVTLPLGGLVVLVFHLAGIDPTATRGRAAALGAAGAAVVVAFELAFVLIPTQTGGKVPPGFSGFGLSFGDPFGHPTWASWARFAFDAACTIGIGALSGLLAWRAEKPTLSAPTI